MQLVFSKKIYQSVSIQDSAKIFSDFFSVKSITEDDLNYLVDIDVFSSDFSSKKILGKFQNFVLETSIEALGQN